MLTPDLHQTRRFLATLDSSTDAFTFQVFGDREGTSIRPAHRHGCLDDLSDWLTEQNQAGAGVFVMVNAGDGSGRKKENVVQVRAAYVDVDRPELCSLETLLSAPLPPDIVVESSSGKWHAYWRLKDCPLKWFTPLQDALIQKFGTDKAVKDLARVMRLPGFYHQKGDPFMTKIVHINEHGKLS